MIENLKKNDQKEETNESNPLEIPSSYQIPPNFDSFYGSKGV